MNIYAYTDIINYYLSMLINDKIFFMVLVNKYSCEIVDTNLYKQIIRLCLFIECICKK